MIGFDVGFLAQAQPRGFFDMLVLGGGTIGFVIWGLSVVTVAIIIQFVITIRRGTISPDLIRQQIQAMFENRQYREAIEATAGEPSMLSHVVHAAMTEAAHGYAAMERAMEEAAEERTTKLLRRIEWLNLIGNVSPMLGLLGTVWGMVLMFMEIGASPTMPPPNKLANSIGIALVTTLLGLGVAIPALSVFSIMRNRIDALSSEAMMISEELISTFRPAPKDAE
jgi:biopolymer transport protein ExbB